MQNESGSAALALDELRTAVQLNAQEHACAEGLVLYGPVEVEYRCPNCGETDGEPRTVYSREFQGDEAHGGHVENADDYCSLCIGNGHGA